MIQLAKSLTALGPTHRYIWEAWGGGARETHVIILPAEDQASPTFNSNLSALPDPEAAGFLPSVLVSLH